MTRLALRQLVGDGLVWDNHACLPLDPACSEMHQLRCCRDAGVDIVSINVSSGDEAVTDAVRMLAAFRGWIHRHADEFCLVGTADEALQAKVSGRLGVCFDIEGMSVLGGNVDMVRLYHDLGVRWMLTAYNHHNDIGGGCLDAVDEGLTAFGRQVVAAMNDVGMVVCGSHAGERTARELIDLSADPVIFSHSNPRAVWPSPRNISDDVMRACARRGGVIGLNGIGAFLGENDTRIETFVNHVAYALDLVGEDHVGIALDYCFGEEHELGDLVHALPTLFPPEHGYLLDGLKMIAPWQLAEIAQALAARGVGAAAMAKVFGGNHLRIAREVWRAASCENSAARPVARHIDSAND